MSKTFHDLHAQLIREASSNKDGDSDATVLEGIIVDVINTGTTERKDSKVADGTVSGAIAVGKEVVSYLRAKDWDCTKNRASLADRGTISKNWQIAYGDTDANTTPKTDILVDGKQVSIKKGPGQLMSGTIAETKATFWAALGDTALKGDGDILMNKTTIAIQKCMEKMQRELPKQYKDKTGKLINNPFGGMRPELFKSKGTVKQLQKTKKDLVFNYIDAFQEELTELFNEAFEKSPELKVAFVKEAMTGERKFVPGSKAIAKYLLSTSKDGKNPIVHPITSEFIKSVASRCEVACRFKTGSDKKKNAEANARKFASVVSANVDTSEDPKPIVKKLEKFQNDSVALRLGIGRLRKKLTPNLEDIRGKEFVLGQRAISARDLLSGKDSVTVQRVAKLLKDKKNASLANWISSGMMGNLPESFTTTNLNTLTESMVGLYEQELITEQELVEGMIDWLGAIKNTLTNNATVAMAFGLRRTESMTKDAKYIADTFGVEVDVEVGKNPIDWNSIV